VATTLGRLRLWWGPVEIGGKVRYGTWDSVDGLDRFEEDVGADVILSDNVLELSTWAGWTVPRTAMQVRFGVESVRRQGTIDEVRAERRFERAGMRIGLVF
jgi:hypothetical protein